MANQENNQQINSTSELAVRREKLNALYESGKNPFEITKYNVTHKSVSAVALFEEKEAELEALRYYKACKKIHTANFNNKKFSINDIAIGGLLKY